MSLLRKKKYTGTGSSGTHISMLKDKLHGYRDFKVNRKKEYFTNDYTYLYANELDEEGDYTYDGEVGVNKGKYKIHDSAWCDEFKDEDFFRSSDPDDIVITTSMSLSDMLIEMDADDDLVELLEMIEDEEME